MNRLHRFFIIATLILVFTALPVFAQQPLNNSAWYAVVYQPETDSLYWINAQGVQGQMPRPHLPDEADFLDLRVSPDGETMFLAARLNTGIEALGVYDFVSGDFVAVHQAENGESISLGGDAIFTSNSQYAAVGFHSGDFAAPAWRLIVFDAGTGNAAAFIDHTHPDAPQVPLSAPSVQVLDEASVHFQLIPLSVLGAQSFPAYAWHVFSYDPALPMLTDSPYTGANQIAQPITVQSLVPTNSAIVRSYPTTDGSVLLTETHGLFFVSNLAPNSMISLAQLTPNSLIAYVTPVGAAFTLTQLPAVDQPVVVQTVVPPAVVTVDPQQPVANLCASALTPRVFVGGMGRVTAGTPTLNVRQQPNGAILTTFGAGTTFFVINGSVCQQDLIWWQIERFGTVGWVAESVSGNYLIEPYAGPMSADPTPTPEAPVVVQPPALCPQALPTRLSIGTAASVVDSLQPHNGPAGESIPLRFYQVGTLVTVNAGPECAGGQWWWLVTGEAKIGRIGQNFETVQGWVAETAPGAYNLAP